MKKLLIFGSGGFAREVAWLTQEINKHRSSWELFAFVDIESSDTKINGIKVISESDAQKFVNKVFVVVGIGLSGIRREVTMKLITQGFKFATLIHPSLKYDEERCSIGVGSIICAGNIFTTNIRIKDHVIINLDCTIGHDTIIEEFVTVSPGCHLSGFTTLRQNVFLGTGTVTREGIEIKENSVIGAGSVIVSDLEANILAFGNPAKQVKLINVIR